MKRSRNANDKKQSSLFGTLLPIKQKFIETGEKFNDSFILNEECYTIEKNENIKNIQSLNHTNEPYELLEKKYYAGLQLQGQSIAKKKLEEWNWKIKPLILCGKSGVGKTCLIRGFFSSYSIWDESFLQEGENLTFVLKELLERKSLFGIQRCIFLDCLDGFTKPEINEITKIISSKKEYFFPFVLSCDDEFDLPKELKSKCYIIKMESIKIDIFKCIINNILKGENLKLSNEVLENLYESCFGNVRFAINELQFLLQTRKRKLLSKESSLCTKDIKFDLFNTVQKLFLSVPLQNDTLQTCKNELSILSKMIHENSFTLFPMQRHWDYLSLSDLLEFQNEEMSTLLLFLSTIINSRKLNLGVKQIRFPSPYFEFETKKNINQKKLQRSRESFETFFKIK